MRSKVETSPLELDPSKALNFTSLSTQTEGYSVSDLKDLVGRAVQTSLSRSLDEGRSSSIEVSAPPPSLLSASTS